MKKIIAFLSIFIIVGCSKHKQPKFVEEIGVVKKSTIIAEYDPSIHQYENVYSLDVQLKDTVYNIVSSKFKQVGDTMIFYTFSYDK